MELYTLDYYQGRTRLTNGNGSMRLICSYPTPPNACLMSEIHDDDRFVSLGISFLQSQS